MGRLIIAVAVACAFVAGGFVAAQTQPAAPAIAQATPEPMPAPCFQIDRLQQQLADSLGERIVFSGLAHSGVRVLVFMNEHGTWSLTDLDADGVACLIGAGRKGKAPNGPIFIELGSGEPA